MIFAGTAMVPGMVTPSQRDPLASFVFVGDLVSCGLRAPHSRPARSLRAEPYGILTLRPPIRNRTLTRDGSNTRPTRRRIMLDVAFVALGLAALALMGAYALALRQL